MRTATAFMASAALCCVLRSVSAEEKANAEQIEFFERKIRPVLVENCYRCHSAKGKVEGGLRLDTAAATREGGDSGAAITPGELDESLLLSAIKYDSYEMPPDRKLPDHVVKDFEQWITSGAIDPRIATEPTQVAVDDSKIDFEAGRQFWSFQLPQRQQLPTHNLHSWTQNRVDEFIAAKLQEQDLVPANPASLRTLARRLSFDLTGLPPTGALLDSLALLESSTATVDIELALGRMVDDLLSSAAYGEHWARMWLDVMRFADDQAHIVGNNTALCYPNAFLYRDWVISALNADLPYDRFVQLQLAADMLTPDDATDDVALGFIGLGPKYYRRGAPEVMADEIEDRIDVLSRGLLGLTVACARCHDHKYDPIGAADYYALAGVFASIEMFNQPLTPKIETDAKGQSKKPEEARHIVRDRKPIDVPLLVRGDVNRPGPIVPRGFLQVLSLATDQDRVQFHDGSGRAELAQQVASSDNPLTARVIVNRVWSRLIGKPLVGTPSNFGQLGERPTHPELLDDLSVRFAENGWSLKWVCREIVMSATYQQSSQAESAENVRKDPENRWLARMNRKRLSVEQWRDAFLTASRQLDPTVEDEHVDPSQPKPSRRTVYSDASRLRLNAMLALFDYPDPNVHSANRAETTTATQKLFLMNSDFVIHHAKEIARQIESLPSHLAIEQAYLRLFGRRPSPEETKLAELFLSGSQANGNALADDHVSTDGASSLEIPEREGVGVEHTGHHRLASYVHGLMMTNEMLFLD